MSKKKTVSHSLGTRRLARRLEDLLDFLVEGESALLRQPISQARWLTLAHLLKNSREELVDTLPLLHPPQQEYLMTLLTLKVA